MFLQRYPTVPNNLAPKLDFAMPQSGSSGGWLKCEGSVKSEGWVACSARKPSTAPIVRATARSTAARRFRRIRTGACRRGRSAPGLRARRPPNQLDPMPDQTACRQSTSSKQRGAGNNVARMPTGGPIAGRFRSTTGWGCFLLIIGKKRQGVV